MFLPEQTCEISRQIVTKKSAVVVRLNEMPERVRKYCEAFLEYGGNVTDAAKSLGISRRTLVRVIREAAPFIDGPQNKHSDN